MSDKPMRKTKAVQQNDKLLFAFFVNNLKVICDKYHLTLYENLTSKS